ncbi:MAG: MBL fold metallo-hydrolase [Saccharofermentans sp.]|nr:MBL fold metallo-hydrolase [Saccharofermentans sp.]
MLIEYRGHSCFKITQDSFSLITDPYMPGSVPGLKDLDEKANQVICSHQHGDHYGLEEVKLSDVRVDTPFDLTIIDTFHDDKEGALRGKNNISVISYKDTKVVHMGDIGCIPEEDELEKLKGCTVLLIPVGGFYTVEPDVAWEMIKMIEPQVVIPMHYRGDTFGYDVIGTVDDFLKLVDLPIEKTGSTLDTDTLGSDRKVLVMTPSKA